MPARKLPRPFEMHWGRGEIVEETVPAQFFSAPKTERAKRFLQQFED